jgi:hypothetical protein
MKERRNAPGIITLHTHDNTRFHHGTQTNLETVHLQNDRVRAFIEPSERCANVQHRHRGVEIRELARVVRSYKLVLPISVNFRFGVPPLVVFGNTFFCFLSLSSVFLSLCDAYVSCAHRVNESEGDEFGRWKREREKERERKASERAQSSRVVAMRDDPNEERDGWIIRPRESFRFKNAHPLCRIFFFSFSQQHVSDKIHIFSFFFFQTTGRRLTATSPRLGSPTTRKRN